MKTKSPRTQKTLRKHSGNTIDHQQKPVVPEPDAFLEEAKQESKRQLIMDHIKTINLLRNEKRFTFRAIAEWLTKRGIEADHSAVYRAYFAAIPDEQRDPNADWSDVDMPD